MRSTFTPNPILERQRCQIRHTGLKSSSKRENSALFMKIVQNALFRSCAARFGQIEFVSVKVVKIVTLAKNSLQKGKTVRFSWKLYKTLFSGHAQHVLFKFIFERQSSQNSHTGLKLSSKRESSALSMIIVQNALFRSCAARFGQIEFVSVKVVKIVTLAVNSLQKGKTVRFSWKLYKTLFSGHAEHVLAKSYFGASKVSNSSYWPEKLFKTGKQCAFHENCTKRSFQVMRRRFCLNRIFEGQTSQNRYTCLKFSSKRENSSLFMKLLQNVLFRSCAARFGQIAFLSVKVLKIVTLAWKALQNEKTVRFPWKLYKTLFSDHAQDVLAKSNLWASKLSNSSHWPKKLFKTEKQCAFHENCTKRHFQVMRSTSWPNPILERQRCQIRHTGLKSSLKRENSALFMKIVQNAFFRSCAARFGQIEFVSVKVVKIVTLA